MSTRSKGVTKRKGSCVSKMCRTSTRNRSKVERLRESLNDLHLEDRKGVVTRSDMWKNRSRMVVKLDDFQERRDRGAHDKISGLTCNDVTGRGSILRRHNCGMHTLGKSDSSKVAFDGSQEFGKEQWYFSTKLFQSGPRDSVNYFTGIKNPSGISSPWSERDEDDFLSSVSTDCVKRPKRKYDQELFHAFDPLNNFKTTKDLCPSSASSKCEFSDSDSHVYGGDGTSHNMETVEYSPSPPNSPLYDMPPPSSLAQKKERRAKRNLQLERWRKYETSKSRQERYERRAQGAFGTGIKSALDSRRVQWSNDLVQTVYIDDISE